MIICDPLCENPAKVIFCDSLFAVFYKKKYPSYGKEHSVKKITFISLILTE